MFYVYVLRNPQGRLYVGFTTELEKRVKQHQEGEAGWTRNRGPWELVYYETFSDLAEALRRERKLIEFIRELEFGSLIVEVQRGEPVVIRQPLKTVKL